MLKIIKWGGAALLVMFVLFAFYKEARPQTACSFDRQKLINPLIQKYKENKRWFGVSTSQDRVYELFVGEKSWTIVITAKTGMVCLGAAGNVSNMLDAPITKAELYPE